MRKITMFLMAGEESLKSERAEITALVQSLNTKFKNIRFKLFKTGSVVENTVDDLNQSEIAFLICEKEITDEDINYFNIALKKFNENSNPKIVTYFKINNNRTATVSKFLEDLDSKLGHYYSEYDSIDNLKYRVLLNLISLENTFQVECKDSKVFVDGTEFGTISQMPCVKNNYDLKFLKGKFEKTQKEFYKIREEYLQNNSSELSVQFSELAKTKNELKKQIDELENNIFKSMLDLAKNTAKGGLSADQKASYRLLEKGDVEAADEILDINEIQSDISSSQLQMEFLTSAKNKIKTAQRQNVDKILQKITAKKLRMKFIVQYSEIEKLYKLAVKTEKSAELEPIAALNYAEFLESQNQIDQSIKVVNELLLYCNDTKLKIFAYSLLMKNYCATKNYVEAEKAYLNSIDIKGSENGEKSMPMLLGSYNNLGNLHQSCGQIKKAEEAFSQVILSYPTLDEDSQARCKFLLAAALNNLGNLYLNTKEYEKAEKLIFKALEIRNELVIENPEKYAIELSETYNSIGNLHRYKAELQQAEQMYLKTIAIRESFAKENPNEFEPKLAVAYNNLATLYSIAKKFDEAEKWYLKAMDIYSRFVEMGEDFFQLDYALTYNNLGNLYRENMKNTSAEKAYIKVISIYEKWIEKIPDEILPKYADSLYNLGILYSGAQHFMNAETRLLESLEIYEKLKVSTNIYDQRISVIKLLLSKIKEEVEVNKKTASKNPVATSSTKEKKKGLFSKLFGKD